MDQVLNPLVLDPLVLGSLQASAAAGIVFKNSSGNTIFTAGAGPGTATAFAAISASGQITSTVSTGTAPLVIASTTAVANLNASLLLGQTWANPGAIGGTTPAAISCTTLVASASVACESSSYPIFFARTPGGADYVAMFHDTVNHIGVVRSIYASSTATLAIQDLGGGVTIGTATLGSNLLAVGGGVSCTTLTASGTVKIAGNAASAFLGMATNVDAMRINAGNALNEGGQVILYGSAFGSGYDNNGALYAGSTLVARWKPDQSFAVSGAVTCTTLTATGTGGVGYATGAGGAVTQGTSRATGVTLNNICGAITLYSAAGSATAFSFTVTNSTVAATDVVHVCQKSGTDKYVTLVTAVAAGSFEITAYTTGGTTTEQPVFNFAVIKAVAA